MESLLSKIDYLVRIAVLGGEAFLNKELAEIIEYLASQKKIGLIIVITNGTIIPDEKIIKSLKHDNVQVWLDKYGNLSNKASELRDILTNNGVSVWYDPIHGWFDFGLMTQKYKDKKDIEEVFDSCYLRHCCGYYNGKLYRCSRTFVLENNGLEQPRSYECIDVNAIKDKSQMRRALYRFYSLDYIQACGWCHKKEDRKVIPTGEQL